MKYGYHYTACNTGPSGPGMWLMLKLATVGGVAAGVWWLLKTIARAVTTAVSTVAGAANAAAPVILGVAGVVLLMVAAAIVALVVQNNQRPPMLPHDRPDRRVLEEWTVEVIDVTPNRQRLNPPQQTAQPYLLDRRMVMSR